MNLPFLRLAAVCLGALGMLLPFSEAQETVYVLEIEAKDPKGGPVTGAEVSATPANQPSGTQVGRSDERGIATFSFPRTGDYTLTVLHDAHRTYSANAKLTDAKAPLRLQAPLVPLPDYGANVAVLDDAGRPVAGAKVDLKGARAYTAATGPDGLATFDLSVPGTYWVQVRKEGSETYSASLSVDEKTQRASHTAKLVRTTTAPELRGTFGLGDVRFPPKQANKLTLEVRLTGGTGQPVELQQTVELIGPKGNKLSMLASGSRKLKAGTPDRQEFSVAGEEPGLYSVRARMRGADGLDWSDTLQFHLCEVTYPDFSGVWRNPENGWCFIVTQSGGSIGGHVAAYYDLMAEPTSSSRKIEEGRIWGTYAIFVVDWQPEGPKLEYQMRITSDGKLTGAPRDYKTRSGVDGFEQKWEKIERKAYPKYNSRRQQ